MKGNRSRFTRYTATVLVSLAAFIAIMATGTYAAYLNIERNNVSMDDHTVSINEYFDSTSGNGVSGSPFVISTATHLKNLQMLTSLGIFSSQALFVLKNDISWASGDGSLLPIGSDDNPFHGTFDGRGFTIHDLVVDGRNTWDVGMFGYVSISGQVKNFFLDHPIVNLGKNSDGGAADTTNPLDPILRNSAKNIGAISYTNGTSSATLTLPATSVSATIDGTSVTLPITYASSDSSLLSSESGTWTTHSVADATKKLYSVHLSASVIAESGGKVVSYLLERWQIQILPSGLVTTDEKIVGYDTDGNAIKIAIGTFKTIWAYNSSDPTSEDHGTYCGFFVGHLDGSADHLGLVGGNSYSASANGTITVVGRPAKSTACLVGRSRSDNKKDDTASDTFSEYLDMTKVAQATFSSMSGQNYPYTASSQYDTQFSNSNTLTTYYNGGDSTLNDYFRLFPGATNVLTTYNYTYYDDNGDPQTGTSPQTNALRFAGPLQAGTYAKSVSTNWFQSDSLIRGFYVQNGFWIWSTAKSTDKWASIFGETQFTVTFKITYVATGTGTNNYWQVLYNGYNPNITTGVLWTYLDTYMTQCRWYDLHNPPALSASNSYLVETYGQSSQYDPVQIVQDGTVQNAEVTISVNKSDSFWNSLFSGLFHSDTWYPCFAVGMGTNLSLSHNEDINTIRYTSSKQYGYSRSNNYLYNATMSLDGTCNLDILDIDIVFKSRVGNSSSLLNKVDYIYTQSECTFNTDDQNTYGTDIAWTGWNTESDVKITFNVSSALSSAASYYFYRETGNSGIGATVHGRYSDSANVLSNTDGYRSATLGAA